MSAELKQNMQILMGATGPEREGHLDAATKQKLSTAYFDLFFGLAGANWARDKKTLGAAWYTALNQIKSMIAAKDKSNPAAMYLNQIHAAHNAKWSQIMMTHANKDKTFDVGPDLHKKWTAERNKQIGSAMGIINATIAQNQKKAETPQTKSTAQTQADIQKKILMFMAAQKNIKAA